MRHNIPSPLALGRQLAEWRQPLDKDPDVEEAVVRMLHAIERHQHRDQRDDRDSGFSHAAAG
jgi:hypothetical protein